MRGAAAGRSALIIGLVRIGMYHGRLPEPGRKPAGVEVFVDRLAAALAKRGQDVTVLTYADDAMPRPYRVRTIRPKRAHDSKVIKKYLAPWLFNVRSLSEFDVFHFHGDDWFYFRRTMPTVRTFYGSSLMEALTAASWRRRLDQSVVFGLELLAGRLATARYAIGSDSRAIYQADGVLGLGVEPPPKPRQPSDDPLIVFIGTWAGRKRGALLHDIFRREILPQVPAARLVMVADHCEPAPNILWLRHPSDAEITDLLLRAWVFCLPSLYEGLGLPYLEAMACGAPVVASPNPGAGDQLRPSSSGLIVEDDHIGDAILSIIRDPTLRSRLSEAGVSRARDFTWEHVSNAYEQAYSRAIERWTQNGER